MKKEILLLILIFIFFPIITADIISINSGGDEKAIINPGANIEQFFFCSPYTCASLGYNCGTWSDNCGGTLNCGTCGLGYTCSSGICRTSIIDDGGDGGGEYPTANITVTPASISLTMAINTAINQIIQIKNLDTSPQTVFISQSGLTKMIFLDETSITLAGRETKNIIVRFVAPNDPGIYTGKILIGNKPVLVTLNVKTKLLLFDSNIVVLNKDYKVPQGDKLKTQVTLIPLGDEERLDVTLNYEIQDYDGKIYLTQSETLLVEKEIDFKRDFGTGILPIGPYIIGLELIYPNGVAPSSAHFEVVEKIPINFGNLVFYLIISILIIAILIIILLIKRKEKKEFSK
jgi:hypothetical protein